MSGTPETLLTMADQLEARASEEANAGRELVPVNFTVHELATLAAALRTAAAVGDTGTA
jgi:predicted DNA-binding transcriptional regulator YafY